MLVDYYEKVVGVYEEPGEERGYFELVLYDDAEETLLLERYESGGTDREIVTRYRVPRTALSDALSVMRQYGMQDWNDRDDTFPIDGMAYVCQFQADGVDVRVTSDAMPDDGFAAFAALKAQLSAYCRDEDQMD